MGLLYRPWWKDRLRAVELFGLAAVAWAVGASLISVGASHHMLLGHPVFAIGAAGCALVAIALTRQSRQAWRQAAGRSHGAKVEKTSSREARGPLRSAGWRVRTGVQLPGAREDADMVLQRRRLRVVVEIKSFRYWGQSAREMKALAQVHRQMQALQAHASIIWLPQAKSKPDLELDERVRVVFGPVGCLVQALDSR